MRTYLPLGMLFWRATPFELSEPALSTMRLDPLKVPAFLFCFIAIIFWALASFYASLFPADPTVFPTFGPGVFANTLATFVLEGAK